MCFHVIAKVPRASLKEWIEEVAKQQEVQRIATKVIVTLRARMVVRT